MFHCLLRCIHLNQKILFTNRFKVEYMWSSIIAAMERLSSALPCILLIGEKGKQN